MTRPAAAYVRSYSPEDPKAESTLFMENRNDLFCWSVVAVDPRSEGMMKPSAVSESASCC